MNLAASLEDFEGRQLPATFEGLTSQIPLDWIESCLKANGVATVRRRKLPVEQVIWVVVGMALFRDLPIPEVISRLDLVLHGPDGESRTVANSAIPRARDRLGAEPMQNLLDTIGRHWGLESAERYAWRGLKVLGIDTTTLRVPDSAENHAGFGTHAGSAYPIVRLAALMALRSHIVLTASLSGSRTSDTTLAKELLPAIPDHSLTILDRYFHNYSIWEAVRSSGEQRHWLVRLRDDLRHWKIIKHYGQGDDLVEIHPTTRYRDPDIPEVIRFRVLRYRHRGFKPRTLGTSLLDPKRYPARELIGLYHERWEMELAYNEIKTETLEQYESIRSESPARVRQEVLGLFIAYDLVRREIEAAAMELNLPPNRISYSFSLMFICDVFSMLAGAAPGAIPKRLRHLRARIKCLVLPPRRKRRYPRAVKMRPWNYPIKEVLHA